MSENNGDSTNNSEKEPEVIYVQYDGSIGTEDQSILLEVTEEPLTVRRKNIKDGSSTGSSSDIIEEIDSPELVNIEDYRNKENFISSPENGEDQNTAVLCETTLEADLTSDLPGTQKDEDLKLFDLVNVEEENVNLIADIPNEALVYACQPTDDDILNRYPCKTCGVIIGCIFCLKSHYESIHLNLGLIQYKCDQTSYLKNYTEICHKCNLVCEEKEEMIDHRKIHFVSCDVCDMSFDSALFLSNHCKTAHEKFEVIISCDLCEQWFKQLQDLSEHYATYHEMILCIVCFKRFATITEMERHHTTHKIVLKHMDTVLPYACSKCNEGFAEISELSTHLTKAHSNRKPGRKKIVGKSNEPRKRGKGLKVREIRFDDCGGLSQDDNTKRLKQEVD